MVLVCGSRYDDATLETRIAAERVLEERLATLPPRDLVILTGGAKGIDTWAENWARREQRQFMVIRPDWDKHGKKAGILRNLAMLNAAPDLVLAFWDGESRGTKHTIDEAQRRGVPVEVISP